MKHFVCSVLLLVTASLPAKAHLLKVFATVENGSITGFAFFVGAGRPKKAQLIVQDKSGKELYRGSTDDNGEFNWRPQEPQMMTVIVNAGDGHIAQSILNAERLSPNPSDALSSPIGMFGGEMPSPATFDEPTCNSAAEIGVVVDRSVDRAVSRQMRPLLEAFSESDYRIRFNDIVSGISMIVGLAGVAMWMSARRSSDLRRSTRDDGPSTKEHQ